MEGIFLDVLENILTLTMQLFLKKTSCYYPTSNWNKNKTCNIDNQSSQIFPTQFQKCTFNQ